MGHLTAKTQLFFLGTATIRSFFEAPTWMLKKFIFCDVSCPKNLPLVEIVSDLRSFSVLCERTTHTVCCVCVQLCCVLVVLWTERSLLVQCQCGSDRL